MDSHRTCRSSRCAGDYIAEADYALGESGIDRLFNSTSALHYAYALNVVVKLQLHNLILVSDREFL